MLYRKYLLGRIAQSVPTLIGLSILIFALARIVPGDPARMAVGEFANEGMVDQMRREMGLDRPLYEQYVRYAIKVVRGDLGRSYLSHRNVLTDIAARLPASLELAFVGLSITLLVGIPVGMVAATHQNRWEDYVSRFGSLGGLAMPQFWIAILLQVIVGYRLGILPIVGRLSPGVPPPTHVTGLYLPDSLLSLDLTTFIDASAHIILPAIVLALVPTAQLIRLVRTATIEAQRRPFVMATRGNGLPEFLILYKYVMKHVLISVVAITGLLAGYYIGNAFVIETVFAWPGLGSYGVQALLLKDLNAIVGVTLVVGVGYAIINIAVDILYGQLDPRIRLEHEQG